MESGLPAKVASTLTEKQISQLHSKLFNEQPSPIVKSKTVKQIELPSGSETKVGGVSVSNVGGKTTITSEEMSEEKNPKKNPWAICHAKLGPRKNAKFESCVKQVKASLEENKKSLSLTIENKIMELLETHLPPKITKKDLLQYLQESPEVAPSKPKTEPKPGTKEPSKPSKKPNPFKNPRPGVKPAPQAITPEDAKEKIIDTIMQILQDEKN